MSKIRREEKRVEQDDAMGMGVRQWTWEGFVAN